MINFNFKELVISIVIAVIISILLIVIFKINTVRDIVILALLMAYLILMVDKTQFPIFSENLTMREELGGIKLGRDINLIPFKDALHMTSLLNVAMFVPIGFLLGMIKGKKWKSITVIGLIISFLVESGQLLTNVFIGYNFRTADVNDLIFNTVGTVVGVLIYVFAVKVADKIFGKNNESNKSLLKNILVSDRN